MSKTIAQIDAEIARLEAEKADKRGRKVWKCPACHAGTQLRNLHLKLMQYYVQPYSCTGGDYWTVGDRPEFKIHCPKCGHDIREIDSDGRGYGYTTNGIFSKKRWTLINENQHAFATREFECKDR